MKRRLIKFLGLPLFAWVSLLALERFAEGQSAATGGGGSSSSGGASLSGGSGFSGGTGGAGISGGGGGGAGNSGQGFSGGEGGFSGAATTSGSSRSGSGSAATTVPTTSNVFGAGYGNPWSRGLPAASGTGTAAKTTFGVPLYAPTTTTGRTGATGRTGTAGRAGTTVSVVGFNTYGMLRDAPYTTQLGEDLPFMVRAPQALQSELLDVIQGSSRLKSKDSISIAVNGATVILRGQVISERERGLAEQLVRLTPGVRNVTNELTVGGGGKQ